MTDKNINISDIETSISCGQKKIKINNITSSTENPNLCNIGNAKDKLKMLCDTKKTCLVANQLLDCPGFDFGVEYACVNDEDDEQLDEIGNEINDEGTDIEQVSTITIETPEENNESVTKVIENGRNFKYQQASDNINDRVDRLAEDPIVQLISYKPLIENPLSYVSKYKNWILIIGAIVALLIITIIIFYFVRRFRRST